MAKNSNNNGDNWLLIGISGLIGAAMAKPSPEQQHKIQIYEAEDMKRTERWKSLGNITVNRNIYHIPKAYQLINEVIQLYTSGFYRAACVFSAVALESVLKTKFTNKRLVDLIEESYENGIISGSDKHYFHALRLDRNDLVHTINLDVNENDAKVVILVTIKILNKVLL